MFFPVDWSAEQTLPTLSTILRNRIKLLRNFAFTPHSDPMQDLGRAGEKACTSGIRCWY